MVVEKKNKTRTNKQTKKKNLFDTIPGFETDFFHNFEALECKFSKNL